LTLSRRSSGRTSKRHPAIDFLVDVRAFPRRAVVAGVDRLRGARGKRVGSVVIETPAGIILVRRRAGNDFTLPGEVAHEHEDRENAVLRALSLDLGVRGVQMELLFRYHGLSRHAVYHLALERKPMPPDGVELHYHKLSDVPPPLSKDSRGILRSFESRLKRLAAAAALTEE